MSTNAPLSFKKEFDIVDKPDLKDFDPVEILKSRNKNGFDPTAKVSEEELTKLDDELMNRFDAMKNNTTTLQDKNELYDLIHEKSNMDKLYFLINSQQQSFSLYQTPLHKILMKMFYTLEKLWTNLINKKPIDLSPADKFYLGLTFFMMAIIISVVFN